ncbi:hypothetical protein [Streptomyces sp. MI02-7b]|uniref:hypothetical protein n=1 Tax=Streptomyces sp. MI02-7b TaxID=462941 RepID=UPI0029A4EE45|nr:hypothetical protein [Streptomyces sp. MI02-7b]MDX3078591.1 hypothetical protein [Streptomyces sp. MI02-7b]
MTLRSPSFLDLETLLSQAEYHDIKVPVAQDIVETTVSKRSGGGKAGLGALALSGSAGSDFQFQSTYSLAPREKATVSKVIDGLIREKAVHVNPVGDSALLKDALIEIEGNTRITAASVMSKVFFVFRRLMLARDINELSELANLDVEDPDVAEAIQRSTCTTNCCLCPCFLRSPEARCHTRCTSTYAPTSSSTKRRRIG